jgi:hypothetical protein
LDVVPALRTANHRTEGDGHDTEQGVQPGALYSRVLQRGKMVSKGEAG